MSNPTALNQSHPTNTNLVSVVGPSDTGFIWGIIQSLPDVSVWETVAVDPTGNSPSADKYFAIDTVTGLEYKRNFTTNLYEPRVTGTVGAITSIQAMALDDLSRASGVFRKATNVAPTAAEWPTPDDDDVAVVITPDNTQHIYEYSAGAWTNTQSISPIVPSLPVRAAGEDVAVDEVVVIGGRIYANNTAAVITVPTPATDAAIEAEGLRDTSNEPIDTSIWITVTADPTGMAVPAGKQFAVDSTTGLEYRRDTATGNWIARTNILADLDTTLITIAGDAPAPATIPTEVTALTGLVAGDTVRGKFDNGLVFYRFDDPGYSEVTRELVSAMYTSSTATDTPVPAKIESPTDAEVLAQVNAITPTVQPGSIHKYITAVGNEIVYDVLQDNAGALTLFRITDRIRIYNVAVLPDPEHFVLSDVIDVSGTGYRSIDDGASGQAWQSIGDDYA